MIIEVTYTIRLDNDDILVEESRRRAVTLDPDVKTQEAFGVVLTAHSHLVDETAAAFMTSAATFMDLAQRHDPN